MILMMITVMMFMIITRTCLLIILMIRLRNLQLSMLLKYNFV